MTNSAASSKRIGGAFRETDVPYLALTISRWSVISASSRKYLSGLSACYVLLERYQGLHGLLDRHYAVEAVDVEDINIVDTQLPKCLVAYLAGILWATVYQKLDLLLRGDHPLDAKFGGQENILATFWVSLEPLANEHLAIAVLLSGIPEGRAQLPGPVEDLEALLVRSGVILMGQNRCSGAEWQTKSQ